MYIKKVNSLNEGPCSECNKGINEDVLVNELQFGVIQVRLCDDCLKMLVHDILEFENN